MKFQVLDSVVGQILTIISVVLFIFIPKQWPYFITEINYMLNIYYG